MNNYILKGGNVLIGDEVLQLDIFIKDGIITEIGKDLNNSINIIDCSNQTILPSLIDPHVHLREPGFEYKETIKSGSMACAKGGYTKVFSMPNLNPVPSNYENLKVQLDAIDRDSVIEIFPIGAMTVNQTGTGEISKMDEINDYVIGYSDDGRGAQTTSVIYQAMTKAASFNKPIIAHVEDEELLFGGYIHDGIYAKEHNHKGISSLSETAQLGRDLAIVRSLDAKYHVCHISALESVDLVRYYKTLNVNVTCEVTPHHLLLTELDLKEDGNFKMNPPLRSINDKQALIDGIKDKTIDMIATDHAPHSFEEKNKGLAGSYFGITGIETAFSLMYSNLVLQGIVNLKELVDLMSLNISKVFGLESHEIVVGNNANLIVCDLNEEYKIDVNTHVSKGKNTPFDGYLVFGKVKKTICKGVVVYEEIQ